MGILDRIHEARQKSIKEAVAAEILKKQREKEAAEKAIRDRELKAQARENAITAHISDTESIIASLGILPEVDYGRYFSEVSEFTGYSYRVGLYTHPRLNLNSSHPLAHRTEEVNSQLTDSLRARNITVSKVGHSYTYRTSETGTIVGSEFHLGFSHDIDDFPLVYLPNEEFLDGGYVHHYGYEHPQPRFDMRRMHEPRLPGIGIQFFKYGSLTFSEDGHHKGKGYGNWTTTTHRAIYFRILPNANVVMTGEAGQRKFQLTSFKKFDDELERVITHPFTYEKREFHSKYIDYGGD